MSNSPLVNHIHWSPNHSGTRNHAINIITIHMVVGQAAVETLGEVFANPSRQASSNYGVGCDGRIGLYVDEANRSWCSSSAWNDHRAITIETASDSYYPYYVNDNAMNALVNLCADICKRNGKSYMVWYPDYYEFIKHYEADPDAMYMTLHKWFAATGCPGEYLEERMGGIANRVNAKLSASLPKPEPEPAPEPKPAKPALRFKDVDDSQSYAKPIYWAVENDIVRGYSDSTFRPEGKCTRAQFVTMIWRMEGRPEPEYNTAEFTDVADNKSYYKPIMWADEQGIIKGYSDGSFRPDEPLTRQQAAVIIWRWLKKPKPESARPYFSDVANTKSSFYAIQWGAEQKIIKGYSDGTFRPNEDCLRRHAVTFLYRVSKYIMG